jgi:hypothetical protein
MKSALIVLLLTAAAQVNAEEVRCDGMVPLDRVEDICGVAFMRDKGRERRSSCTVSYVDRQYGATNVGGMGISPELVFNTDNRVNDKGRIMAPVGYNSSLNAARERGWFKEEISGLGEGAFYSEYDIHMKVTWYQGKDFHVLNVQKGKPNEGDWTPACSREQIVEIARLINSGQ